MNLNDLFNKKRFTAESQLNEIDPRNYDSDEDYYNDLHGDDVEDDDFDDVEDDDFDDFEEPESHYEKSLRVRGLGEGSDNVGASIRALYQKIYAAGDDEIEYFYNDSPIFAQYWDEYEGDLDSIIAEVDPGELQVMLDELESYVQNANLAEGNETTPFGSVNDQRPQMPDVPQQDREAQEQARERQARISDFREKKQDLLQQFAQLGTLRTEMIYGLENNVFLSKEQLIDFFKQQIDDPSLTALEYAYENDIPTGGLMKHILRRATQLGISMVDVRKLFASAKQKVSENSNRKVDAKGRTQSEWMQLVKQRFPDAKIVQAKMIDGPAHALLSDGRKIVWNPVQGVAEAGQNFRRGNARRAALNAMSPEELRAHEEKRAEQQRKRDEARLERERQQNAAKKGVAEGEQQKGADYRNPPEADYGDDYQAMVMRLKKLAGAGPLKTVYDPNKRVYKNMPTATQPKTQPKK